MAFLNGETQIIADEAFCNAVRSYYEVRGHKLHVNDACISETEMCFERNSDSYQPP